MRPRVANRARISGAALLRPTACVLCVPGMGMILWGESPLYIVWEAVILTALKSTSRRQGRKGDRPSERSPSAKLRADEQKLYIKAEPQGESAGPAPRSALGPT
jgi:hypothetical protein